MACYTYILVSRSRNALYVGATDDLRARLLQHRKGAVDAHSARYRIELLVWYEAHATLAAAERRERQIARWRRVWKDELISAFNPSWRDSEHRGAALRRSRVKPGTGAGGRRREA